jgi:hypothetical protein
MVGVDSSTTAVGVETIIPNHTTLASFNCNGAKAIIPSVVTATTVSVTSTSGAKGAIMLFLMVVRIPTLVLHLKLLQFQKQHSYLDLNIYQLPLIILHNLLSLLHLQKFLLLLKV